MISLLYHDDETRGKVGAHTLHDLVIDQSFRSICKSSEQCSFFLNVISDLLISEDAVVYRQQILQDFMANPGLLHTLHVLLNRFLGLKKEADSNRRENMRFLRSTSSSNITGIYNLLRMSALTLKRELLLVQAVSELLSQYPVKSDGLIKLKIAVENICKPCEFTELLSICAYFESISIADNVNLLVHLGQDGQIDKCEVSKINRIQSEPDIINKLFGKKNVHVKSETAVSLNSYNNTTYQKMRTEPFREIISTFDSLSGQIIGMFSECADECGFYEAAMKYCSFIVEGHIPLVFPEISDTSPDRIVDLYDLFLLTGSADLSSVVPNDYLCSQDEVGKVIFGKNSGGKTVYLRAVGTAQILAQAGLPIPARSASVHCCNTVATLFSSEEREDFDNGGMGRFEQEVIEMSRLVNSVSDKSLVLLNECFQTTAYDEGAAGLVNILDYLTVMKTKYIVVSHMHQLESLLSKRVDFLRTGDNYKIQS